MKPKVDFHVITDKSNAIKAKELSGLTYREIFEVGCRKVIEENQNALDKEILELNDTVERVNELTGSIRIRLHDKEVPTRPSDSAENNEEEIKRNILPFEFFQEILFYYMDDFGIKDVEELNTKNKEVFRFVLINIAHYKIDIKDINEMYGKINSS